MWNYLLSVLYGYYVLGVVDNNFISRYKVFNKCRNAMMIHHYKLVYLTN